MSKQKTQVNKKQKEPAVAEAMAREEVLQSQLARALADYDNFRKRTEREQEILKDRITAQLFSRILPAVDMLMETQKHLQDSGLAMTIQEFLNTLKAEQIEIIEVKQGEEFDEQLHEVVETVELADMEDGKVTEQVATGWRIANGPVIRHARVKVVKRPDNFEARNSKSETNSNV